MRAALFLVFLLAFSMPARAVDYIRLSPSEFAEDLVKASELAAEERYAEAIPLLEILVNDEPHDADALTLMGYCLRKTGDYVRAEIYYDRALVQAPQHPATNQYLGEMYVELGRLEEARERLAVLDATCGGLCPGRDALAAAIEAAE